jgi:hypothetical protein
MEGVSPPRLEYEDGGGGEFLNMPQEMGAKNCKLNMSTWTRYIKKATLKLEPKHVHRGTRYIKKAILKP